MNNQFNVPATFEKAEKILEKFAKEGAILAHVLVKDKLLGRLTVSFIWKGVKGALCLVDGVAIIRLCLIPEGTPFWVIKQVMLDKIAEIDK